MAALDIFTPEQLAKAAGTILTTNPLFKVGQAEIRGNVYRVFENAPPTLGALFAEGARHGDKTFLIFNDEKLTFGGAWEEACRFANALKNELGVKQGDRVAIAMRNYPEWCTAYMAITSMGAVVVPLNAWWKTEELEYALADSGAKLVIADGRRSEYLSEIKDKLDLTIVLARDAGAAGENGVDYRFDELVATTNDTSPPQTDIHTDDDFCIIYTSGSTGNPKGVILTHRSCINTIMSWTFTVTVVKEARGGVPLYGDNPGILLCIPLFHVTASHSVFLMSYVVGRRVAMMHRWDPVEAVEIINREELSNFVGVPSQSFELIKAAGDTPMPSLLDIGAGGAKRPADHVRKLVEKFKNAKPSSGYGLTETNAMGCIISMGDYRKRPDSTGRSVPPVNDLKIVLEDGETAPTGEVGEIWLRSASNFRGYLNLPEETADSLTPDGWFKTGDLARQDEEGFVYIVDRKKELIIRGGENISCLEVENHVYGFPGVREAVVFSVPDDALGERVGTVIYPKEDTEIDPLLLREFLSEHLAGYKVPERIWMSPGPLPRLGTEKFDKITVRKIALANKPAFAV